MGNTTADKLALLAQNKAAIKAAINAKNPATPAGDVLSQYPTAISSIPTGGILPETIRATSDGKLYCEIEKITY